LHDASDARARSASLPVMLSVVWIVNRSKGWYEGGRTSARFAERGRPSR